MAGKLIMYCGLPGSGKSTAAEALAATWLPRPVIVNKDDIRARRARAWSEQEEAEVLKIRDREIGIVLSRGGTAISSDTNFAPKHERKFRELCKKYKSEFETIVMDTPLDECIRRDALREVGEGRVGEAVIRKMAAQYLVVPPDYTPYVAKTGTPRSIIVDIDGTVALHGDRSPYDTAKAGGDLPNQPVIDLIKELSDLTYTVIYVSGRDAEFRLLTIQWLIDHGCPYDGLLFMRPKGDTRNDAIVKLELFNAEIREKYDVRWIFDDRNRVVEMWRKLGLTCMQVADGAF